MYCERQWWNSKLNLMPCSRKSFLKNTKNKNMQKFGVFLQSATIQEWDFLNVGRFPNGVVSRIGLRYAIYFFKNSIEHSAIPVDGELSIITDRHITSRWTEGYGSLRWNIFHSEWNERAKRRLTIMLKTIETERNLDQSNAEGERKGLVNWFCLFCVWCFFMTGDDNWFRTSLSQCSLTWPFACSPYSALPANVMWFSRSFVVFFFFFVIKCGCYLNEKRDFLCNQTREP